MTAASLVGEASPHARITGTVYLLYFVTAILAQMFITRGLITSGRAVNLLADVLYIMLTLSLYRLFAPVNRRLSLVAALFSLAGCALMMLAQFHLVGPRLSPLIFFGPFCILTGYLICRSIFVPHLLGFVLIFAGIAWIIYALPGTPRALAMPIQALGILAEALLMFWLLAKGVSQERWLAQNRR